MSGKTCHKCGRSPAVGEYVLADSWWVIDADGVRHETRYTCPGCE